MPPGFSADVDTDNVLSGGADERELNPFLIHRVIVLNAAGNFYDSN